MTLKRSLQVVCGILVTFFLPTPVLSQEGIKDRSFYSFTFRGIEGDLIPLHTLRGKAVLIVNTASKCGFTKQYEDLQMLYATYAPRGLEIIAVPSNDFNQEPADNLAIKQFCDLTFQIRFPLTEKTAVTGSDAHPFYLWAAAQNVGGPLFSTPRWNFHKYLIDRQGRLIGSFSAMTKPLDKKMTDAIDKALE